ncbi:NUDIX domain-containing protein [Deinococcus sp. Marseille-Q6407]|uniref:NUDIX domain-containing protein n=1 Tax=Deinococcus sp. Marseille-Q6407 TaxID=2969223 RepID=UPI0028FC1642|nr:NUDIX domain-containing protein [Deinococcus sp. Marseille-Q6407]
MDVSHAAPHPAAGGTQPGAGGVVFNRSGAVLLVQYRDGSWTFPKGHLEPGETPVQTAAREVLEETGIQAAELGWLPPTRYTNNRGQQRELTWFLMEARSETVRLEETFQAGGFVTVAQAAQQLNFAEDQQLLWQAEQQRATLQRAGAARGPLYALDERMPQLHPRAYVAPTAAVIGSVELAEDSSVWFGAVLRGDIEPVRVGPRSNVQDGAVLHTDQGHPCILEADVTVGHGAIVHGAHCEQGSLIGMGATLLSGSRVGRGAVVGAGALLREGDVVPDGMVAVGVPARVVGSVGASFGNADRYVEKAQHYRQHLRALPQAEGEAQADRHNDLP